MFNLHEKVCDSFIAAIKESVISGTPLVQIIAYLDQCKETGIIEWYAQDGTRKEVSFKLVGDDRKFRISERGLLPFESKDIPAAAPTQPSVAAPQHIKDAAERTGRINTAKENNCENCNPSNPWKHLFGNVNACVECGALIISNKRLCRYCEDINKALPPDMFKHTDPLGRGFTSCPVCGSIDVNVSGGTDIFNGSYMARCATCNVQTRWKGSPEEALGEWNGRIHLSYTHCKLNPCPICGGEAIADIHYPDDGANDRSIVVSKILCRYHGCVSVTDSGVNPHEGVIPKWKKLTAPFLNYSGKKDRE
jgi:Lar family restriction alleviation protein